MTERSRPIRTEDDAERTSQPASRGLGQPRRTPAAQTIALGLFIALCFGAAGIGALITTSSVGTWYQTLSKPVWTPPDWVFGPVWTALYFMMALAGWLVWRGGAWANARAALYWFAIQLVLNVGWSVLFFGLRSPGLAFLEILPLWLSIAVMTVLFHRRSTTAANLVAPYFLWTAFAAVLNFAVWRMNS